MLRFKQCFATLLLQVLFPQLVSSFSVETASTTTSNHQQHNQELLIFGLGRVGREVAILAQPHLDHVAGTVRNRRQEQNQYQYECIPIEEMDYESRIARASHILIAMPPDEKIYSSIQKHFFNKNHPTPKWLGLVSTTGVYGNYNGTWVTEESPLLCNRESSAFSYQTWERRLEQEVVESNNNCRHVRVFRCAGIYDSSASALHTLWKKGYNKPSTAKKTTTTIAKTNRIHAFDIAQSIVSSMMMMDTSSNNSSSISSSFRIYNVADDCPAPRSEVMEYAAHLLEEAGISLERKNTGGSATTATTTPTTTPTNAMSTTRERRRETELKLVDNRRLKSELLPELQFPTYKEGLKAILKDPIAPWNGDDASRE
jgi:hypothetical protein